jgi:hypothetical protein
MKDPIEELLRVMDLLGGMGMFYYGSPQWEREYQEFLRSENLKEEE